jgi:hypothetical protein
MERLEKGLELESKPEMGESLIVPVKWMRPYQAQVCAGTYKWPIYKQVINNIYKVMHRVINN